MPSRQRAHYAGREAMRLRQRVIIGEGKATRLDLGLTQHEVARVAGMQQSAVSDLERILTEGAEATVTVDTLMTYLAALGLTLRVERLF